jgi:beta-galactosidase
MLSGHRILWLVCLFPAMASAQVVDLAGEWRYGFDLPAGPELPSFDEANWPRAHVPHNLREIGEQGPKAGRTIWFRRRFEAPPIKPDQRVVLRIDNGAAAAAWLNGKLAGRCNPSSYWLETDVTALVQPGENSIAVKTLSPGIQGGVRLQVLDAVHLDEVMVDTHGWAAGVTPVRVRTRVQNRSPQSQKYELRVSIYHPNGRRIATASSGRSSLPAKGNVPLTLSTDAIPDPPVWSIENPQLSKAVVELATDFGTQKEEVLFGFRWFRFDHDKGFELNGQPLKLRGTVYTTIGPKKFATRQGLWDYEINLLKTMGINFIRPTPGVSDEFVAACDRAGILTTIRVHDFSDVADGGPLTLRDNMRRDVQQKYNHPSAIAWNVVGEGGGAQRATMHTEAFRALRAHDPTRPVLCNELGWRSPGTVGLLEPDIAGEGNYTGWYEGTLDHIGPYMDIYRDFLIERYQRPLPVIVSNYGAAADPRVHTDRPRRNDFSQEYHTAFHQRFDREFAARDWMAGGLIFCWRDIDGGQGIPRHTWKGIIDLAENKRDAYYYYQSSWTSKPMVHIAQKDWNPRSVWPAGSKRHIHVFSNCSTVELFHNAQSLGSREKVTGFEWEVPLAPGSNSLRAVASVDGQTVEDQVTVDIVAVPPAVEPRLVSTSSNMQLVWDAIEGISQYAVYAGPSENFEPSPANRIGFTSQLSIEVPNAKDYYKVAAADGPASIAVSLRQSATQWRFVNEGWLMSSPALADLDGDDQLEIVVGSYSGKVYAVTPQGRRFWEYTTFDPVTSSPIVATLRAGEGPAVVFTSSTSLYVLSARGELLWKRDGMRTFDRNPKSPAVGDLDGDGELEIVVASDTGELRVFAADGQDRWRYLTADFGNRGISLTNPLLIDSPAGNGKSGIWVCFAADDVVTYVLDGTGKLVWKFDSQLGATVPGLPPTGLWPAAGRLEKDGPVRIVSGAGLLRVFDIEGKILWERADLSGSPQISRIDSAGRRAILVYQRDVMTAVDASGRDIWKYRVSGGRDFFTQPPVNADVDEDGQPDLLVGTRGTYLRILDGQGREKWSVRTDDEVSGTAAVGDINHDGYTDIVFGSRDGYLRLITGGRVPPHPQHSLQYRGGPEQTGDYGGGR